MPTPQELERPEVWDCETCGECVPMRDVFIDRKTNRYNCRACDEKIRAGEPVCQACE